MLADGSDVRYKAFTVLSERFSHWRSDSQTPRIKVTVHTSVVKSSDADEPTNVIAEFRNLFDGSPASPLPRP